MDYKLEFWNEDGQGSRLDLIDNNSGEILYPYSLGISNVLYFNGEIEPDEYEIIEEQDNVKGVTVDTFIKTEKYEIYKTVLSTYQISALYLLNFHSNIYMTDENGLIRRIQRMNIVESDRYYGFNAISMRVLFEDNIISISGK